MSLPRLHSYTWSDVDEEGAAQAATQEPAPDDRLGLIGKELHLWVTYPDTKTKANRKQKGRKSRRVKPKLWAVIIVERVEKQDDFTYEVTLKRIYKKGDRLIRIWVRNDPEDQSEDAVVFGVESPRVERLDPLERQLSTWAAKRVYDAIAETWMGVHT